MKTPKTNQTNKRRDVKLIAITVLVCALIAGVVVYHQQSVNSAYKQGYKTGVADAKQILVK